MAEAFGAAVDATLDDAYRLAGFILGDAAEAEDAVQDALVKAWNGWPGLRQKGRFPVWLDQIVVNTCRDRLRRRRLVTMLPLEVAGDRATADPFRAMVEAREIAAAVARLEPDHRIVIALRFWRDLPIDEIAVRLGIPAGTAKSRVHYALRALRAELREVRDA